LATSQLANGAAFNVTGLASGLDTNALISALMAVEQQPEQALTLQQQQAQAQQTQLQSIQTALQQLSSTAAALQSPSLFNTSQSVTSSNSTQVSATTSGGSGVGGYEVTVTQLANSAQRTFTYASPASNESIAIDGHTTNITAGESAQDFVNSINSDTGATVWAAVTSGNTIVLSSRATGDTGSNFIQVTNDTQNALTEQTSLAKEGKNAIFNVDGTDYSEASNTVTDAIAGVTLTLNSPTGATTPVTITVQPPAPNTSTISSAVQSFVNLYNSTIQQIETQLSQTPVSNSTTQQGTLYEDQGLQNLLFDMRQMMYAPIDGQPTDAQSLSDIGISTGAPTGSGTTSQATLSGQLTLDANALTTAIQNDPNGVQSLIEGFANNFQTRVNTDAAPGGTLDSRIQSDSSQISDLQAQISTMNEMLQVRQAALEAQYASLESTLSQSQSTSSWLTSQITGLQANAP
jgi:flagellar hook-associated protein 2